MFGYPPVLYSPGDGSHYTLSKDKMQVFLTHMFNKDMVLADMIAATKMLKNNDYLHMLNKPPVKRPNTTTQTHSVRDFTGKSNFFSQKA